MAKTRVEVLNAVVGGAKRGEQIEIDSRSANHLASIGYVKVIEETATQQAKAKAEERVADKPKKKTKKG